MTGNPPAEGPSKLQKIWRRTWVGALELVVLVGALWLNETVAAGWVLVVAAAALTLCGVYELARMLRPGRADARAVSAALVAGWGAGVAYLLRLQVGGAVESPPLVLATWYGWVAAGAALGYVAASGTAVLGRGRALVSAAAYAAWLAVPLHAMFAVWLVFGTGGLVALIALSKIGDIAGYYVGNAIGRHHPFPRLSPGKTVEGCAGSLVAGAAAGALVVALGLLEPRAGGPLAGLLAGAVVNVASQAADLLESWVKRRTGAKDSGTWFGPAGGVLDLVDSLLLSVPAALLVWPLLFLGR